MTVGTAIVSAQMQRMLAELAENFVPEMKLSIICRHPTNEECFLIATSDDLKALAEALLKKS